MSGVRGAFILSSLLHGSIVLAAVVTLPKPDAPSTPPISALPVDLVTVADETDVTQGSTDAAEVLEEAAPKTVADAEAPAEPETQPGAADAPADRITTRSDPADTPSESAAPERADAPEPAEPVADDVAPQAPAPDAEPAPPESASETPAQEVAAEPIRQSATAETAQQDASPAPERPAEPARSPAAVPAPRPTPPRPTETARVERETVETFDAESISQLINRDDASGGGQGRATASLGSDQGRAEARLTLSEQDYLRAQMQRCWSPPVGVRGSGDLIITVQFKLAPDGAVTEIVEVAAQGVGRLYDVAADSARRAVLSCQPYNLPPEKYAAWKEVRVNFDPRELF